MAYIVKYCVLGHQSLTGFSVSFFWPATTSVVVAQARATKNKRRRRRRGRRHRVENKTDSESFPVKPSHHEDGCSFADQPPNDAHHLCADGNVSEELGEATPRADDRSHGQVVEMLERGDSIEPAVTKLSLSDVHIDSYMYD
jgi:hypothetical protein